MSKNFLFCLLILPYYTFAQIDCSKLSTTFSTYEEAENRIRVSRFTLVDKANTAKSSWIRGASFYSCNKRVGFLILTTYKGNFIYKNLPIVIWYRFKSASSLGSYYTHNIRNRYQLYLSK